MNYFDNKSFFIFVFTEALSGIKSGEYKVDENGLFLKDTYLNVLKFDLIDKDETKTTRYLVTSYQEGMEQPRLDFPEDLLGPGTDKLVEELYQEIQKKFRELEIEDYWGEYFHNRLENYIKNKKERN